MEQTKGNTECVKVMVRVRPMNKKETAMNCKNVLAIDKANNQVELTKPDRDGVSKDFAFDAVYGPDAL